MDATQAKPYSTFTKVFFVSLFTTSSVVMTVSLLNGDNSRLGMYVAMASTCAAVASGMALLFMAWDSSPRLRGFLFYVKILFHAGLVLFAVGLWVDHLVINHESWSEAMHATRAFTFLGLGALFFLTVRLPLRLRQRRNDKQQSA